MGAAARPYFMRTNDFKCAEPQQNQGMTFKFTTTEWGPYEPHEEARIDRALKEAGRIVEDTYKFRKDIFVNVQWVDLADRGGGANGGPTSVDNINEALYPSALAKQHYTEEEWLRKDPPKFDIRINFDFKTQWYFGLDKDTYDTECDFLTIAVHEIHHGLGWSMPFTEVVAGMDGAKSRLVRRASDPYDAYEKFLCFKTTDGDLCPVAPYLLVNSEGLTEDEKRSRQEKLLQIYQGKNLYFIAGDTPIRLYTPDNFRYGTSISHIDFGVEKDSVMEPYTTDTNRIQHTIGPRTQQVVNWLRKIYTLPPDPCECDKEPLIGKRKPIKYAHARNKAGSIFDLREILKPKKTIDKKTKRQSQAIKHIQNIFKLILRLDVQFKARLQIVDFKSEQMDRFTRDEKENGITVQHLQGVKVDGVFLPTAVAKQISDQETLRRLTDNPKFEYDIDIFVDSNVDWDYNSTRVSSGEFMGFKSTLLSELSHAFRFENCLEYVEPHRDEKGKESFEAIRRKLFLDSEFPQIWMCSSC